LKARSKLKQVHGTLRVLSSVYLLYL
jgi:hypothetical protein